MTEVHDDALPSPRPGGRSRRSAGRFGGSHAGRAGSTPTSGATSASCSAPALDAVVTAEETVRRVEACRTATASQAPSWHWMGNYGSVYDVQNAANSLGVGAGGLVTQVEPSGSGLFPTFMYY